MPILLQYEYAPSNVKQIAVPMAENVNKILRPRRSTRNVATYVPSNWIKPTTMAEKFADIFEPDSTKIFAV